jgi:hypothetical protein
MQLKYFFTLASLLSCSMSEAESVSGLMLQRDDDSEKLSLTKNFWPTKILRGSREKRMKLVFMSGSREIISRSLGKSEARVYSLGLATLLITLL